MDADTIFIEGLRISGKHGVLADEHDIEQPFVIDLSVTCDARKAAQTDDLSDAVNYVDLRDTVKRIIEGEHCNLIEKIAAKIADEILKDQRITEVRVTIRKPAILPSGIPGLSITRKRSL